MLSKSVESETAMLAFEGTDCYITGPFKDDYIEGDCELILDGRYGI